MRIGGAAGATALAILLFLLDKEVEDLQPWVLYPGLVACALVILLSLLGGRVGLRSPVVLQKAVEGERVASRPADTNPVETSPAPNAFDRANALQREWQGKQKRVALARIAEELEAAEQVLNNPEADYYFAEHALEHPAWDEHAERLIEAELMALHKTVRAAYRALDALETQGVRRGMVTSQGRKIAQLDGGLLDQARAATREAIAALDEAQESPPTWQ